MRTLTHSGAIGALHVGSCLCKPPRSACILARVHPAPLRRSPPHATSILAAISFLWAFNIFTVASVSFLTPQNVFRVSKDLRSRGKKMPVVWLVAQDKRGCQSSSWLVWVPGPVYARILLSGCLAAVILRKHPRHCIWSRPATWRRLGIVTDWAQGLPG